MFPLLETGIWHEKDSGGVNKPYVAVYSDIAKTTALNKSATEFLGTCLLLYGANH